MDFTTLQCNAKEILPKACKHDRPTPRKIDVKRTRSMTSISVFTLIRTDTTLDLSQKAEKVKKGVSPDDFEYGECKNRNASNERHFISLKKNSIL